MRKLEKIATKIYIPIFTILAVIILSVIAVYTKIDQSDRNFIDSFELEDKQVYQTVYGENTEKAISMAENTAIELNMKISDRSRNSQIKKINESVGQRWVKCDSEIISLIDKCIEMSKLSMSTFDITSGNLLDLWNLDIKNFKPGNEDIKGALSGVNYNDVRINHDVNRVKLDNKSGKITLKYIQEGAICSSIVATYGDMALDYAVASVGNTTGVYGAKPNSTNWKLSVKDKAQSKSDESGIGFIKISRGYMCTLINDSINQDKLSRKKTVIIDLKTGYPVNNKLSSVTVIHDDAVIANGLAYICNSLGRDESEKTLNYYKAGAIFVYKDKSVYITRNIKEAFVLVNRDYYMSS